MRKKTSLLFIISLLFLIPLTSAQNVAYISKNPRNIDQNIISVFSEYGFNITLIKDKDIKKTDFSPFSFVFIGDEVLRNTRHYYDLSKYKTIIMNPYYGEEFGITDVDGISRLASTAPLEVVSQNSILQVYTQARVGSLDIAYYFLGIDNKASGFQTVAVPYLGNGQNLGDVVSFAEPGSTLTNGKRTQERICFYGIAETKYWTSHARNLFKKCVAFIGVTINCTSNADCNDSNQSTQDICNHPGTQESFCSHEPIECSSELDCGQDDYFGTRQCQGKNATQSFIDFTCNNPGTPQSRCSNETSTVVVEQCAQLCFEGNCSTIVCSNDQQCNDDNLLTFDQCINPGTRQSRCDHTPINCAANTDCGQTGFIGSEYCNNNDVYKNFQNATCNNGGTIFSFCTVTSQPRIVQNCPQSCSSGTCIQCNTNDDCDDHNGSTTDVCVAGGTPESFCRHTPTPGQCTSEQQCGNDGFVRQPFCQQGNVYQNYRNFTCNTPGTPTSTCSNTTSPQLIEQCAYGCSNGQCSQPPITCTRDSDCGQDGYSGNRFCSGINVQQNFTDFSCNNAGTPQSTCSSSTAPRLIEQCAESCQQGSCVTIECDDPSDCNDHNPLTFDQCINPGTPTSDCRNTPINCAADADCGFSGFIGNEFCTGQDVFKNYRNASCINPGTLSSYCNVQVAPRNLFDCPYACTSGTCIRCDSPQDCDDANSRTTDTCINSGTVQSRCENTPQPVTCSTNTQCGADGFTGQRFCQNNDVYQNFRNFMCNLPGTQQSYCSNATNAQFVLECGEDSQSQNYCFDQDLYRDVTDKGCSGGTCFANVQRQKVQECAYGCEQVNGISRCKSPPIVCSSDLQCGTDGFVGQRFCQQGNVYQNYQNFSCHNPGTPTSTCANTTQPQLIQICSYGCNNGVCIDQPVTHDIALENLRVKRGETLITNNILIKDKFYNLLLNVRNLGTAAENINFEGKLLLASQTKKTFTAPPITQLGPSQSRNDHSTSVLFDLAPGFYTIFINAPLSNDANLQNNQVRKNITLVTCINSSDCDPQQICQNPGTINSNCVNQTIRCYSNSDCNDNNQLTFDACIQPGTPQSYCRNTPINCAQHSDCGFTGFVGQEYCNGNDIFKNFQNATCNNGGTLNSYCNVNIQTRLLNTCPYACTNATCIRCDTNSDCNDNNAGTTDVCRNPGTLQSFCQNTPEGPTTCGDTRMGGPVTSYGMSFTPVSNTVDESSTNTLSVKIKNNDAFSKTITYQKYSCRCREHFGNPFVSPTVCNDYWPFTRYTGGDGWTSSVCKLVNESITLGPNEEKATQIKVTQYRNMKCGSFQTDLALVRVNGVNVFQPLVAGVVDLCTDCPQIPPTEIPGDAACLWPPMNSLAEVRNIRKGYIGWGYQNKLANITFLGDDTDKAPGNYIDERLLCYNNKWHAAINEWTYFPMVVGHQLQDHVGDWSDVADNFWVRKWVMDNSCEDCSDNEIWTEYNVKSKQEGMQTVTVADQDFCILSKSQMELPLGHDWGNPYCKVGRNGDEEWWLQAFSDDGSHVDAHCSAVCSNAGIVTTDLSISSESEGIKTKMLGKNELCALSKTEYLIPSLDDPSCKITKQDNGWTLEAFSPEGSVLGSHCSALCLDDAKAGDEFLVSSSHAGPKQRSLGSHDLCYLSRSQLEVPGDNWGNPACKVGHSDRFWWLQAFAEAEGDLGAHCAAICRTTG